VNRLTAAVISAYHFVAGDAVILCGIAASFAIVGVLAHMGNIHGAGLGALMIAIVIVVLALSLQRERPR